MPDLDLVELEEAGMPKNNSKPPGGRSGAPGVMFVFLDFPIGMEAGEVESGGSGPGPWDGQIYMRCVVPGS